MLQHRGKRSFFPEKKDLKKIEEKGQKGERKKERKKSASQKHI